MKLVMQPVVIAGWLLVGLTGCKSGPVAYTPPPAAPVFTVSSTRAESSAALVDRNAKLGMDIAQLPGNTGAQHRELLVPTLDDLSKALQLANGPVQSPEFTNRIAVIEAAQATAQISDVPAARLQAVENQALLAAAAAMDEITTRFLFDDDQLPTLLDALSADVSKASDTVGPLHDVDATHAFRSAQIVMQRMSDDMVERFGTIAPPPGTH